MVTDKVELKKISTGGIFVDPEGKLHFFLQLKTENLGYSWEASHCAEENVPPLPLHSMNSTVVT